MKHRKLERNAETKSLRAQKCEDFVAVGVLFCLGWEKGRGLKVSECHLPGSVSLIQAEPAVEGAWRWEGKRKRSWGRRAG